MPRNAAESTPEVRGVPYPSVYMGCGKIENTRLKVRERSIMKKKSPQSIYTRSGVKGRGRERDAPMCQHAVDAATHEEAHYDEWQLFHGLLVVIDTTGPSIPPA